MRKFVEASQPVPILDRRSLLAFERSSMRPLDRLPCGQIVRDSCSPTCDDNTRGYVWDRGTMIDLSTHIQDNPGWTVVDAAAINDRGQFVGFGISPTGDGRAILLTRLQ